MRITVHAKPRSHINAVERLDETTYRVSVQEPPVEGRANTAIVRTLADHFHVAPSLVRIISGHTSRQKIVDIAL